MRLLKKEGEICLPNNCQGEGKFVIVGSVIKMLIRTMKEYEDKGILSHII